MSDTAERPGRHPRRPRPPASGPPSAPASGPPSAPGVTAGRAADRRTPASSATGSRYPLYADEVDSAADDLPMRRRPRTATTASQPAALAADGRRRWWCSRWSSGSGCSPVTTAAARRRLRQPTRDASPRRASPRDDPPAEEDPTSPPAPAGNPADLAADVHRHRAATPLRARADLGGNPVAYPPANMLDDDLATAYRVPGDASGETVDVHAARGGRDQRGRPRQRLRQEGHRRVPEPSTGTPSTAGSSRSSGSSTTAPPSARTCATEPVLQTIAVDKVRTQHDLAAHPRGVPSRSRRDEQGRDRDQRRPAPRQLPDPTFAAVTARGNAPSGSRAPHASGLPCH